jgi:spore germination cell wall hydrolase CwlJ-like protein
MKIVAKKTASVLLAFSLLCGGSGIAGTIAPIADVTSITVSAATISAAKKAVISPNDVAYHATPYNVILKKGSKGDMVKWVQCALNKLKITKTSLKVDGDFGSNTESAVKAFQKKYMGKNEVDGKVGPKTIKALKKALGIKQTIPKNMTKKTHILLCNCVAHEANLSNISMYEKAAVVEVIMNRVSSKSFPNSIEKVIKQSGQFSGSSSYANLNKYSNEVTDEVKEAVTYYFNNQKLFNQGYLYLRGNGSYNFFSKTYRGKYTRPCGSGSITV